MQGGGARADNPHRQEVRGARAKVQIGDHVTKVELHAHTAGDPEDVIPYDPTELIDRAAALGYAALAITLHDRQLDVAELVPYAAARGVSLIPGIERTIDGRHLLLLNFPAAAEHVESFDDVARLKAGSRGLVVAPHPFFPLNHCLGSRMEQCAEVVDAVEISYFHTPLVDFNRAARRWASRHDKPLVGTSDVHRLSQLGRTYSVVDADPTPDAICAAIRAGRVEVRAQPISLFRVVALLAAIKLRNAVTNVLPAAAAHGRRRRHRS